LLEAFVDAIRKSASVGRFGCDNLFHLIYKALMASDFAWIDSIVVIEDPVQDASYRHGACSESDPANSGPARSFRRRSDGAAAS